MRKVLKDMPNSGSSSGRMSDDYLDKWQDDLDEWGETTSRYNKEAALMFVCWLGIALALIGFSDGAQWARLVSLAMPFGIGALHTRRLKRAEQYYKVVRALEEL